ncbi:MAG: sigma-70 family RNA polymerase sigma factor [Pseudonocardiaceae bacterium]
MTRAYVRWSTILNPHAWCRLVASRLYADRLASLEEPAADIDTAGSPLLAANTDWDAFEQRHEILRLLEPLPLRQRQVMAWTYDGCTPAEIAEALKVTPEAVRSSLKKARAHLKMFLEAEGGRQS